MSNKRIAVTGMGINTPLADDLGGFLAALLDGQSAISRWQVFDTRGIYSKVGGDLSGYDPAAKLARLKPEISEALYKRLRPFVRRAPWATKLSTLVAADAWLDSGLDRYDTDPLRVGVVAGGHNLNSRYIASNAKVFRSEPDHIDGLFSLHSLDTDHATSVSEALRARGPVYTVGAACASGNAALRCAVNEIRYHDMHACVVVGCTIDFAPADLHGMWD